MVALEDFMTEEWDIIQVESPVVISDCPVEDL